MVVVTLVTLVFLSILVSNLDTLAMYANQLVFTIRLLMAKTVLRLLDDKVRSLEDG